MSTTGTLIRPQSRAPLAARLLIAFSISIMGFIAATTFMVRAQDELARQQIQDVARRTESLESVKQTDDQRNLAIENRLTSLEIQGETNTKILFTIVIGVVTQLVTSVITLKRK